MSACMFVVLKAELVAVVCAFWKNVNVELLIPPTVPVPAISD
jgi:hypothetical protein